jgi:predicted GIY-YIG superfamily endonuclease
MTDNVVTGDMPQYHLMPVAKDVPVSDNVVIKDVSIPDNVMTKDVSIPDNVMTKDGEWVVYVLSSVPNPMRTYAGSTNHLARRLRQHNGELTGGALATKTSRPWKLAALVSGFGENKCRALRYEWFCKVKHYTKKHGSVPGNTGPKRRKFLLEYAKSMCTGTPDLCVRVFDNNMI